jgi:hypothetical protein
VRTLTGNNEDRDLALVVAPDLARIKAASGSAQDLKEALSSLREASEEAHRRGFVASELEARLASGELGKLGGREAGPAARASLEALQKEATTRGYLRLARRTGKVLAEAGSS